MYIKRSIALLLTIVMLLSMCPVSAFATEDATEATVPATEATEPVDTTIPSAPDTSDISTVELDQEITLTVAPEEEVCLQFTAPEDGAYYIFTSRLESGEEVESSLYSSQNQPSHLTGSYEDDGIRNFYRLDAGTVYELEVFHWYDDSLTTTLVIHKATQPETISFSEFTSDIVGTAKYAYVYGDQKGTWPGPVTWSIEDESIATCELSDTSENGCKVNFLQAGETTLIATDSFGNTVSHPIRVKALHEISLNETIGDSLNGFYDQNFYHFTAPADGTYAFNVRNTGSEGSRQNVWLYVDSYEGFCEEAYPNKITETGICAYYDLTAGTDLTFIIRNASNSIFDDITLTVEEAKPVDSVTFSQDAITGKPGDYVNIIAYHTPESGYVDNLEWTLADGTVAYIDWSTDLDASIYLYSEGTTELNYNINGKTFSIPITVEDPTNTVVIDPLTSGETREDSLPADYSATYSFTPTVSGRYVFCCTDTTGNYYDPDLEIQNPPSGGNIADLHTSSGGYSFVSAYLEAGVTYGLKVSNYSDMDMSFSICVKEAPAIENVVLSHDPLAMAVGEQEFLYAVFTPDEAHRDVTFEIADTSIVEVESTDNRGVWLRAVSVGTTTVTASVEDHTLTCTVTVSEPQTLELEVPQTVTVNTDETVSLRFAPETSGEYVFTVFDQENTDIELYNVTYGYIVTGSFLSNSGTFPLYAYLEEGVDYLLKLRNRGSGTERTATVYKVQDPVSITLDQTSLTRDAESEFELTADMGGFQYHGNVEWTSSDPSIVSFRWQEGDKGTFYTHSAGTAIITASVTTSNGSVLTASCEVTVNGLDVFGENITYNCMQDANEKTKFKFIPDESGFYTFKIDSNLGFDFQVLDSESDYPYNYTLGYGLNCRYFALLESGEEYTCSVENYNFAVQEYSVLITKTLAPTKLSLRCSGDIEPNSNGTVYLSFDDADHFDTITWTSSNPDVVSIMDSGHPYSCQLYGAGEGTAVITATSSGGLSASIEVKVKYPTQLTPGYTEELALASEARNRYQFTPAADGYYSIILPMYVGSSIYDTNFNYVDYQHYYHSDSDEIHRVYYLYADVNYEIEIYNYDSSDISGIFRLIETPEPDTITLNNDSDLTVLRSGTAWLSFNIKPGGSYGEVTAVSSNDQIARVESCSNNSARISCPSAGSAVITISCGNALLNVPITVVDPIPMKLDTKQSVSLASQKEAYYSITTPSDGWYEIVTDSSFLSVSVSTPDGGSPEFSHETTLDSGKIRFYGNADESYDITLYNYAATSISFRFHVTKLAAATSAALKLTEGIAEVGNFILLTAEYPDGFTDTAASWSVSDESILTLSDYYMNSAYFNCVGTGTATVTMKTLNEVTASFTVTVTGSTREFSFAEESYEGLVGNGIDVYLNYYPGLSDVRWSVDDESVATIKYCDSNYAYLELCGPGETTVRAAFNGQSISTKLKVHANEPVESIVFDSEAESVAIVDNWGFIPFTCSPIYPTDDLTVTFTNPDVITDVACYRTGLNQGGVEFLPIGCGSSTITVTASSGVSASFTVTVPEPDATLQLNRSRNISLKGIGDYEIYSFTPAQSGVYAFYTGDSTGSLTAQITSSYAPLQNINRDGLDMGLVANLDADVTYYLTFTCLSDSANASLFVEKAVEPTNFSIKPVIRGSEYNGFNYELDMNFSPINAFADVRGVSDNNNVASVVSQVGFQLASVCFGETEGTADIELITTNGLKASAKAILSLSKTWMDAPIMQAYSLDESGKIQLKWDAVEHADSYNVYYSSDRENWSKLKTLSGTRLTHGSGTVGTTYYYYVEAVAEDGSISSCSNVVFCTRKLAQPEVTLSNIASSGKIRISWTKVSGAVSYEVFRATGKNGTYQFLASTKNTYLNNVKNTEAGKTYYYKVIAVAKNADGNSAESAVKYRVCDLASPVVTLGTVKSTGRIKISWKSITGAKSYRVYRATSKTGTYTLVDEVEKTSLIDSKAATAGRTYYYRVEAVGSNSAATSARSGAKALARKLAQPKVTVSNAASTGKIKISWNKVTGAESYKVYRATSKNGTYKLLTSTTGTSVINSSNTTAGKTYYYKVIAVCSRSAGNSAASEIKSRMCDLPRPTASVKRNSSGKPVVSWNKVTGAAKYKVYIYSSSGKLLDTVTTTSRSWTHGKAKSGTTYIYRVVAVHSNSSANSAYSQKVSIKSR